MANEVRGLLYETITHYVLINAVKKSKIAGEVFWNEKPDGMSINPDFTVGSDKNNITHIILVTASGSTKESEKKSWRNLGETFEAKSQLSQVPIAINLYFKSEVKKGLSEAVDSLFDSTFHIDKKAYFKPIKEWVEANISKAGNSKELRSEYFEHALKSDSALKKSVNDLCIDMSALLTLENSELKSLWSLMAKSYQTALKRKPFLARNTYVKRGLGKLMVFEEPVRQVLYKNLKKVGAIKDELPDYCFELGFFTKTMAGSRLVDDEIKGVISLLGKETCETVIDKAPEAMNMWIVPLRNLARVSAHVDFVYDHYEEVASGKKLQELLTECYKDPAGMSGIHSDVKLWLFEIMVSLLKAKSGKLQGYGLAKLAVDCNQPEFGQGGFVIPPFVQREKMLPKNQLQNLAEGLAQRFAKEISEEDICGLRDNVVKWVIKENLEDRLIPYRNFEPLLWLLEAELNENNLAYYEKSAYTGWINEYAEVGRRSATTPFVRVGNTLIHWKTVSDAGRGHKKKELAARARAIRYEFDAETGSFKHRENAKELVLLVDGTFDDKDLRVLQTSGWDRIVYPDEIDSFVVALAKCH